MGVLYVLDEPSIGLHPRDNDRLLTTLKELRDLGNTVLIVEHDEETIRSADWIIDLGPGAGEHGGWVVAQGTIDKILSTPESLTGRTFHAVSKFPIPTIAGKEWKNLANSRCQGEQPSGSHCRYPTGTICLHHGSIWFREIIAHERYPV